MRSGTALYVSADRDGYVPTFNVGQSFMVGEFIFPTLGKARYMQMNGSFVVQISAQNDILFATDTGSGPTYIELKAADLAARGLSIVPGVPMQFAVQGSAGQAFVPFRAPFVHQVACCINGQTVEARYTTNPTGTYIYNSSIDGGMGTSGYVYGGDLYVLSLSWFANNLMSAEIFAAIAKAMWNNGRGVTPHLHPFLRRYLFDYLTFNLSSMNVNKHFVGLLKRTFFRRRHGFSAQELAAGLSGRITRFNGQNIPLVPAVQVPQSNLLADYLHPDLQDVRVQGPAGDIFGNFNTRNASPLYGLTGPIKLSNGATDLPPNYNGLMDLSGNRICGTTAGAVVVSNITRSYVRNFFLCRNFNNWYVPQYGPGTHDLTWAGQEVNMVEFGVNSSRLSALRIRAAAGKIITLATLNMQNNGQLTTGFNQLYDANTRITTVNCHGTVFAAVPVTAWNEDMVNLNSYGPLGIAGPIPPFPAAARNYSLMGGTLTEFPPLGTDGTNMNGLTNVGFGQNKLAGLIKGNKLVNLDLCNSNSPMYIGVNGAMAANPAAVQDFIDIDLSGSTAGSMTLTAAGAKVRNVTFPTAAGFTFNSGNFCLNGNPALNIVGGFPASMRITVMAFLQGCGTALANAVLPIGSVIRGTTVWINDNGMTEATVNANVDNWLAGQANFASAATLKSFILCGTNASPTNANNGLDTVNFATRIERLNNAIEANNWAVMYNLPALINKSYVRINSFQAVAGQPTFMFVECATNVIGPNNGWNLFDEILSTVNYNGTGTSGNTGGTWKILAHAYSAQECLDKHNKVGQWATNNNAGFPVGFGAGAWFLVTRIDGGSTAFAGTETGVIRYGG